MCLPDSKTDEMRADFVYIFRDYFVKFMGIHLSFLYIILYFKTYIYILV